MRVSCSIAFALLLPAGASAQTARPLGAARDGHAGDPRWSPDGRFVSFEVALTAERSTRLILAPVDGGAEQEIAPPGRTASGRFGPRPRVDHELAWAPASSLYAFASTGGGDDFDLWVRGVSVPIGGPLRQGGPAFSADGRWLAYTSESTGAGDIYLADVLALDRPPRRISAGEGLEIYAAWAPDRPALAWTESVEGGSRIVIAEDATGDPRPRPLTDGRASDLKPSWSPDGRTLAWFSSRDADTARFDLWIGQVRGGEPRRLLADVIPPERRGPAWRPDGGALLVVRRDPDRGDPIAMVTLDGVARELALGTVNNAEPSTWGSSGSAWRLAFTAQGAQGGERTFRRVFVASFRGEDGG